MNGIPIFFNVTENIPYFTQSQAITTGVSQTATTVNYVNVGLKIKILPNIRQDTFNGGIYAELSELVSMASSGGTNPTTAPDTSLTNTAVPLDLKWGSSFILTGFKTKQNSTSATGVPLLSKLPLIGALFGYQEKDSIGSEIAIVVTATKTGKQEVAKDAK
jgi:general secretion pathway protein D